MSCILAHPTGNNFVREAATALHEAGLLGELHLGLASTGDEFLAWIGRLPGCHELRRRSYPPELASKLYTHPLRELLRLAAIRMQLQSLVAHERGFACIDACAHALDRKVAARLAMIKVNAVYAYEDSALETFRAAKDQGAVCIYDLPIAYWKTGREILEEESVRLPQWKPTLIAVDDSPEKCARKDEELALADHIVCPSQFVAKSLPADIRSSKPIHIIPFGSPMLPSADSAVPNGKIKVLFAGSMSQRKGLADLMAAMRLLDTERFELHVMGSLLMPMKFYSDQCPGFVHHSPRPHAAVLELMQQCDVFVLPSLVEGRALVQQEALACGLPIIVTANAGAEDLVEDGQAGFLTPTRQPEAIAEKLQQLADNPDLLVQMSHAAPQKAAQVTWENYRNRIVEVVSST